MKLKRGSKGVWNVEDGAGQGKQKNKSVPFSSPFRHFSSTVTPSCPWGKIVGNKLMLIDQRGRQTLARDGIYTVQGGAKIKIENGQIIDVEGKVTDKSGIIGIIDVDN